MSVPAEIKIHLDAKRLHEFASDLLTTLGDDETPRRLFISNEVAQALEGADKDTLDGERLAQLYQTLEAFVEGGAFSVAGDPFNKPSDVMLARVHPIALEIWDVRSTEPPPGVRALGGFWEKDMLILVTWAWRESLEGSVEWNAEIEACDSEWRNLFGARPRLHGSSIDDYLTNFEAVDP